MDEATQALLADVPGIDRNDPAIQAALAVMRLEKPQAPRPSAEPRNIMRQNYGWVLYKDPVATLDDLREAVTTLEEIGRIAQRVLGGGHPTTEEIDGFFLPGKALASMVWRAERDSNSIYSLTAGAAGAAAATVGSGSFAGDGHAGTSGK